MCLCIHHVSRSAHGIGRLSLLGIVLCSLSAGVAEEKDKKAESRPLDRRTLNALIDSLVNHNEKPKMVNVNTSRASPTNPLFADNYDWKEDYRVFQAAKEISKHSGEDLWWCLMEHLDDERYAISYAFNDYARVASIGHLCCQKALDDLQMLYWQFSPGYEIDNTYRPLRVIRSFENLKGWYHDHKNVPLFQQQIELCEAAIVKIQNLDLASHKFHPISDQEKAEYIANIKKQIEKLRDTKKPILISHGLLQFGDYEFYNADLAKEIKEKYLQKQKIEPKTK